MDNKSPPAAFGAAPILPFVAGALAVAIFAIDTLVPLDSAIAALYAIVVLLAANYFQERGVILLVSVGCLALTVLSFLAQHSLTADAALVRCLVSLLAIGATTFLALANTRLYRDLAERETKIRRLVEAQTPQAEDELHAIVDNAPVFLWSDLPDGYCDFLNQRWLNYFDLSLQEAQGTGWATVLHPDDAAHHLESWQKSVSTGIPFETEARFRLSNGEYRWFLTRADPLRDKTGRIVKWYGTNIDIENLKRTEGRLRQSEAYLAEAQRLSHTGTWAFDATTTLYWSEEGYRIWGLDPLQGLPNRETVWQRIHPDDRDRVYEEAQRALREKRDLAVEFRIVLSDGTVKYLESISRPVFSEHGELVQVVGTNVDVTERKRAEEALRESEYKLRQIIETVPSLLWSTDPAGEPTQLNQRMLDYSGMRYEDFLHGGWEAFVHADDFPETASNFYHAIQTGTSYQAVNRLRRADGEFRWHHTRGEPLRDEQGHIIQWYGLSVDIDEAKKAENRLRESEAKIRRLVDANIIGIFIWDFEGRIIEANDAFLRMVDHDREDLVSGRIRWTELTPPEWLDRDERRWAPELKVTGSLQPFEKEYFRKDGSRVPVLIGVASFEEDVNQGVAFVLDLTERKRAEAEARESERRYREALMELAHANRVATMGQLTASIAHEVSQPIAGVVTNAQTGLRWLGAAPPNLEEARHSFDRIVKDGSRASDVIGRIRGLVKKAPPLKARFDLNEAVLDVIALTRSEVLKHGVSLETQLGEGLPLLRADRVQLQQVILNLILNAVEAMGGVEGGTLKLLISTEREPSGGVLVTVRDTGPGLDPQSVERLFEAFYTTKPEGMGMGLSISRSIIEAHKGRIWASANEPRGAVVQFTLPPERDGTVPAEPAAQMPVL